jgi:hypothetical protein
VNRLFIIFGLGFVALVIGIAWAAGEWPEMIEAYQKSARASVFTAFVTLGSFLLTMKTNMLQRLKEAFDSPHHEAVYRQHRAANSGAKYYAGLGRMSRALAACVPMALVSSALQMTLGWCANRWLFALCVAAPTITLCFVLYLWFEISQAHRMWLDKIEHDKTESLK